MQQTTHPPTLINPTDVDIADAAIDRARLWRYPLHGRYTVSLRVLPHMGMRALAVRGNPNEVGIEVTHEPGEGFFVGERKLAI